MSGHRLRPERRVATEAVGVQALEALHGYAHQAKDEERAEEFIDGPCSWLEDLSARVV